MLTEKLQILMRVYKYFDLCFSLICYHWFIFSQVQKSFGSDSTSSINLANRYLVLLEFLENSNSHLNFEFEGKKNLSQLPNIPAVCILLSLWSTGLPCWARGAKVCRDSFSSSQFRQTPTSKLRVSLHVRLNVSDFAISNLNFVQKEML
jgi:hypothetical protein